MRLRTDEELIKLAHTKEAFLETLRHGAKAFKQAFLGGRVLKAGPGLLLGDRVAAVNAGQTLISQLGGSGIKVHRARVKSPRSMAAKNITSAPDDLLGMQVYGRNVGDVKKLTDTLHQRGVTITSQNALRRPGYHGVNIKGTYRGTPLEVQMVPSRRSNMGQLMEHALSYKQKTEAPLAIGFDKWVGKKIAPRMVSSKSWIPG